MDEFASVTGCHLKAAIRLLRRGNLSRTSKKRGRPRRYGASVVDALNVVWKAFDRLCSKRLHPLLPQLLAPLKRHGQSNIPHDIEGKPCQINSLYY